MQRNITKTVIVHSLLPLGWRHKKMMEDDLEKRFMHEDSVPGRNSYCYRIEILN